MMTMVECEEYVHDAMANGSEDAIAVLFELLLEDKPYVVLQHSKRIISIKWDGIIFVQDLIFFVLKYALPKQIISLHDIDSLIEYFSKHTLSKNLEDYCLNVLYKYKMISKI